MQYLSFANFNLYNLNEPGLAIYSDQNGWDNAQYAAKIDYTARAVKRLDADVIGFQELWHHESLTAVFEAAGLANDYDLLVPAGHSGKIVCAAAVKKNLLVGSPHWVKDFPDYYILQSQGDDPQTAKISVQIDKFSRPVLKFRIKPRDDENEIEVYVCHFKSKGPTRVYREDWYKQDKDTYKNHTEALGSALSTIRRTAEATALRLLLTDAMKGTDTPVVVLGDINDGQQSNTLNILTGQPNFLLSGLQTGGSDVDLYTTQTLQQYRSQRDVYYTHVYKNIRESLDHILVSQEFYDNSKKRRWAFEGMVVDNDHLHYDNHKTSGTNDHGLVKVTFRHRPVK